MEHYIIKSFLILIFCIVNVCWPRFDQFLEIGIAKKFGVIAPTGYPVGAFFMQKEETLSKEGRKRRS